MDFQQLARAVAETIWKADYARFKALIDEALETTQGEEHGRVLTLQANWFLIVDTKNAAQGLVLINEALPLVRKNPEALMDALIVAISLSSSLGDTERARSYEETACALLLEQGASKGVRSRRHRLHICLGRLAYLRGDYTTAYWYFVQAANNLSDPAVTEQERLGHESVVQVNIATSCLRVRRYYEAQEALELAAQSARAPHQHARAKVWHAELLRQLGRIDEAVALLDEVSQLVDDCRESDLKARFLWVAALVAQDSGNLPAFHRSFAQAQELAAEHRHDYLLSEMQRFQNHSVK